MKILGISNMALAQPLWYKLQQEGNEVVWWVQQKERYGDVYSGLLEMVNDWHEYKDWADLIFVDDTSFGVIQEQLRDEGKTVFGSSKFGDEVELERAKGLELAKKMNVRIPEFWEFDNWDEGIEFVERERIPLVLKFEGGLDYAKTLSYVSRTDDSRDLLELMKFYKSKWTTITNERPQYLLQQRIDGVEVAVGAFHNGDRFMMPICVNFEHKHYRAEGVGMLTGEEGTVMRFQYDNTYLYDLSLRHVESDFADAGNIGYVDVNGIFNDEGYWFLEFTVRLGYPLAYIQQHALTREGRTLTNFLTAVLEGEDTFDVPTDWFIGVVLSVPPYPYDDVMLYRAQFKGMPILYDEEVAENLVWVEVAKQGDYLMSAGSEGYLGVAVAGDQYLPLAMRKVYDVARRVYVSKVSYRTDIGQRVINKFRELLEWGII